MAQAFAEWPEAIATTLEIAERCDVELELGRQLIPRYPTPSGESEGDVPARARARGAARALRRSRAGGGARARRLRARRDRADGLQRLLPDRVGLRQVRQGLGDRGRAGPRLGRRLAGRLLAADHRRRSAPLRPAVRALPQPRARVDAGHRHRLLGARPRARDPVRDRQVRQGVGGADRHVRQDVPAGGDARRRARARARLRRRRPPGQADPRPDHGPAAELRGLPEAGPAAARRGRPRPDRQADRRGGAGPRGDRPQLLDPRRRGRDRRPAADRHRPAPDRRRRRRRERRARVPHRDPVHDEAGRADRAAQDGLPRACATST